MDIDPRFAWVAEGPARLNRRAIPDIPVTDQDGRRHDFYTDLVRGRLVMIAFTSITHDAHYPCTPKLAQVRAHLDRGPAAMAELYTITLDPEADGAAAWSAYARAAGAGRGWRFLRASADDVEALRGALFVHRARDASAARVMRRRDAILGLRPERAVMDCSLGMLRYGDEGKDIWGGAPVRADARAIAERLEWLASACVARPAGRRRAGPFAQIVA